MGKKRNRDDAAEKKSKWWCYYCEQECRDETALIAHQRAKHFRCPHCEPGYPGGHCHGIDGLFSHVRRSHNKELLEVPGALPHRKDPTVVVEGMTGIPKHLLDGNDGDDAEPATPPPWGYTSSAPPMVYVKKKEPEAKAEPPKPPPSSGQNMSSMIAALMSSGSPTSAGLAAALAQLQNGNMSPDLARALQHNAENPTGSPDVAQTLARMAPGSAMPVSSAVPLSQRPGVSGATVNFVGLIDRVCGHWEDSNGKLIVITSSPTCKVQVKHETRGNQEVKFIDFIRHGKISYAGREGSLEGNTLEWDNGAVWAKVKQEF